MKNLKKYTLLVFCLTIVLSFIIINKDNSFIALFNNLDIQTELFSMGIPNGNESFGVSSNQCTHCLTQGVEVWVIFGKANPRCGNPCD